MAKYLLLKHYRGGPTPPSVPPMDQWTLDEVEAHIQFMNDFATRLQDRGEFVDGQALSPDGVWVRSDTATVCSPLWTAPTSGDVEESPPRSPMVLPTSRRLMASSTRLTRRGTRTARACRRPAARWGPHQPARS